LLFESELGFVAGVLVVASAALAEVRAGGDDAVAGGGEDFDDFGLEVTALFFDDLSPDHLLGESEGDEDGFAGLMTGGWKMGETVATVHGLLDLEGDGGGLGHRSIQAWLM
jgi:hypothetical protein